MCLATKMCVPGGESARLTLTTDLIRTLIPYFTVMANHQQQETVMSNGRPPDGEVHVSVAANETVDTSEGQTIMIIQEDNQLDSSQEHHVQQENCTFQITNTAVSLAHDQFSLL